MNVAFTDLTPEGKRYFAELNKLCELVVKVGYQAGDATYDDGTDITEVAAMNEYGGSDRPARPFMKTSFTENEDKLHAACDAVNHAINGGSSAEAALKTLGVTVKGIVQEHIVEGGFAPNAPSTIARKGSAQPLIDTGLMRQSVNYVVEKG